MTLTRAYIPRVFSHRSGRSRAPNALSRQLTSSSLGPVRLDLCSSNPTTCGIDYPPQLEAALLDGVKAARSYTPAAFGLVTAREAAAAQFATTRALSAPPDAEDVLLTASTSEAYAFAFKLLCDAGDEVLVPSPSYPLFEHLAELESVRLAPYRLAYDGAWHVDLDSARRAVTPRTRAVIVVSPNNPTGQYCTQLELAALAELGLPIISDEVFFEYPLAARSSAAQQLDVLQLTLGGLSKLAGSPQLKLAWTNLSGPEPARREARERLELIADTFLSVGAPIQHALPALLAASSSVTQAIAARCRENLAALQTLTASSLLTPLRVEGGWSAVLRLPSWLDEDAFVLELRRADGVLVQPGWFYDFETQPLVVLSLLSEPQRFREGCERLVARASRSPS
jgi:aspartate/methionine/tyrosine aminotransferase